MDDRPVVWDEYNRRHLTQDHPERGIRVTDVEEAMNDPNRIEAAIRRPDGAYRAVIGRTHAGDLLYVACVDRDGGRFPVHARRAGGKLARRYEASE